MKTNRGNIVVIFFLIFVSFLRAEDFSYTLSVDNKQPFVKEGIVLKVDFSQTNHDIVLMFDFDILKSDSYDFKRFHANENDTHHNTKASYSYLLYPLKTGDLDVKFKLTKKVTTDASVAYSFSGDRDNVKGLVTTDTKIDLAPLKLSVKKLPPKTMLVGDFKLTYSIKKKDALAYEPINMQVVIKGKGYPPKFEQFPLLDGEFKLFSDKPLSTMGIVESAINSKTTYSLALSATKSFILNEVFIKAFNPKTKNTYFLKIPKQNFEITQLDKKELVDKVDNPKEEESYLKPFLYFLIVFLAGFISGYFFKFKKEKLTNKIKEDIKIKKYNCRTKEALHKMLLSNNDKKYKKVIKECEKSLYIKKK